MLLRDISRTRLGMIKLAALAAIVLGIVITLTGCSCNAGVPDTIPVGDEAAIRSTLDLFFDALDDRDYEKATGYVAGTGEMSEEDKDELESTLIWMRFTTSGFTGETFDNITVMDSTAKASYTKTTTDEDGSFSFSVELDMKKENGIWKIDLS